MTWHPFAERFPLLSGDEWTAFLESVKADGQRHPISYRLVGGVKEYLDGRNRVRACKELGLECREEEVQVADEAVKLWILRRNVHDHRHLTVEVRRQLVAELRADGQSERAIAEAVGVSQSTVHRDIKTGDSHESPAPSSKQKTEKQKNGPAAVKGRDGKSYPAKPSTPSVFCRECRVRGPKPGCKDCAALRKPREAGDDTESEAAALAEEKAKGKNGQESFHLGDVDQLLGKLLGALDKLYKQHGLMHPGGRVKEDADYREVSEKVRAVRPAFAALAKKLAKERKGA